ncbi:hypothetical protein [Pseudostreptobacillus hongkongensis]|uniref:hypothetical protein n=1 Tax=Pseudostreptobacillus hongkongensis TaxID=1162717 RepID=UPI0028D21747|nr:hypothetical protein [Pseudostreptobacillus hongkongensis]
MKKILLGAMTLLPVGSFSDTTVYFKSNLETKISSDKEDSRSKFNLKINFDLGIYLGLNKDLEIFFRTQVLGNGSSNSFKSENDIFLLSILLESKRNGGKYKLGSVYDLDAKGKHKLESVIQAEKDLGEVEVKEKLTHKLKIEDNVKNVGSLESEIKYKGIKDT